MKHHKKYLARILSALRTNNAFAPYFNLLVRYFSFTPYHHAVFAFFQMFHDKISWLKKWNKFCFVKIIIFFIFTFFLNGCRDKHPLISVFPLKNYDQTLAHWIKPTDSDYDVPVLSAETQQHKLEILYKHYFGASSPWSEQYINKIINQTKPNDLKTIEDDLIKSFSNRHKKSSEIGYGENFRPHSEEWLNAIYDNIHLTQFENLSFDLNHRAIAVDNLHGRALPTEDVFFYHHTLAGQGYPFDNLQISAIWVGTPLYVLGETRDHAWSFVVTPDFIAWVKSSGIAYVDKKFIKNWSAAAAKQLIGITHTQTSVINHEGMYQFTTYVGTFFPGKQLSNGYSIHIPVVNSKRHASIGSGWVSKDNATPIPLTASPHFFSRIMQTLLGRPYGWGNLYFYNDCSAELKNLFIPFGVWLPRHSSQQVYAGKLIDLSQESTKNRIRYLLENGRAFTTLVYIDGHILLFIGNYANPNSKTHEKIPMTYQNMWGLKPHPSIRRAVIGKSVIFPMLEQFPEDTDLTSQASKQYFQMSQLDGASDNLLKLEIINLKELMYP